MKVLVTTDAVGGVWEYSVELARGLRAAGVEVVVASVGPPPSADQRAMFAATPSCTLIETDLPLDWLCADAAPVLAAGRAIAELASELSVDLIQLNMPTLAAAGPMPVPTIAVTHGCVATWWEAARPGTPLARDYRWHSALTAAALRNVERVVAPSAAYAAIVRRHYGLAEAPLAIHNGRTPLRAFDPAEPIADVALTVGRLWDGVKNAALLDRAAARLPIPFLAAGAARGPHGETIRLTHLRELGQLSADQIAGHLAKRPVFVSAASFEPFGLAVLEAAQAGCALVLADNPTFRELWGGAALFVPIGEDGWCTAIEGLILDPSRRHALGEAARSRAGRYTPAASAAAMLALYRDVLAARPPASKVAA
ncbi:glycosyltransferase family 4 protein [Sphingomonas sp. XXL09]|uniref:glycosyltransferase family 4 protein n=1 Tax=Sphingomonas sp. XXL09 TaxID=3457787 RepID=UPI00406BC29A